MGCQKSKKTLITARLPIINIDVLESVELQVNSTQTHKQWPTCSRTRYLIYDVVYFRKNSDFP